jgi:PAS domain S-box-containing protein
VTSVVASVPAAGGDGGGFTLLELPEAMQQADVLVVDDNPANLLLLQRVLQMAGLQHVQLCNDSRTALERCATSLPDLLLLDLHMPHPDGFEVMQTLRSRLASDAFLPILVLTADVSSDVKRRALAAGAKDFLTKPLDNIEVLLRVRNLLETRRLVRTLGDAIASQGQATARERALRRASMALGAAGADRNAIQQAACDAARVLTVQIKLRDVRVDLAPPEAVPAGAAVVIPLTTQSATYGAIVLVGTDSLPKEVGHALDTLAAQVALALETAALTDDLRRRDREEAAAALLQHSSDVVAVVDANLAIRFVTPSVEPVLGFKPECLLGRRLTGLFPPEQAPAAEAHFAVVATVPGTGPPMEWALLRPDGARVAVEVRSNTLLDDPRVGGIVVTIHDITEHKAFREGLERQVQELRELDRMKSDLVSTVSHELRTPLTSIVGHTEMLADGDAGELTTEQAHIVGIIDRNGQRLLALIEDLLTLARVESQGLHLDLAPNDVAALVGSVRDAMQPSVSARSIEFVVDVDPGAGLIVADGALTERALANLLSNAIKFTPKGGVVELSVRRRPGDVLFTVRDTGIGISAEDQKRLFTRFFRSSVATVNAIPGTGLGLSIVKQIVDEHGGVITVDSAPGEGTTVSFTLPLAPPRR